MYIEIESMEGDEEENALLRNGVECKEGISFASQLPCEKIQYILTS